MDNRDPAPGISEHLRARWEKVNAGIDMLDSLQDDRIRMVTYLLNASERIKKSPEQPVHRTDHPSSSDVELLVTELVLCNTESDTLKQKVAELTRNLEIEMSLNQTAVAEMIRRKRTLLNLPLHKLTQVWAAHHQFHGSTEDALRTALNVVAPSSLSRTGSTKARPFSAYVAGNTSNSSSCRKPRPASAIYNTN